jgi:hypothetical protein
MLILQEMQFYKPSKVSMSGGNLRISCILARHRYKGMHSLLSA